MLINYLRIAVRNILKHKGFSIINITGLAVGMAVSMFILLWVRDELSYDRFHRKSDDIYGVLMDWKNVGGARSMGCYAPLGPAVKEEIPGVVDYTRIQTLPRSLMKYEDKAFYEEGGIIADPSLFDIFSFPLVKGDPHTGLSGPFDVIISETLAQKYFGQEEPMGKAFVIEGYPTRVKGIMKDVPRQSHLQFDFFISFKFAEKLGLPLNWGSPNYAMYVQLQKGADIQAVSEKITAIASANNSYVKNHGLGFPLIPLKEIYLDPDIHKVNSGNRNLVYSFFLVALFILVVACINYINLSTARSSSRALEVGIRKTLGADRVQLVKQLLVESVVLSLFSVFLAVLLTELLLPEFNRLSGKQLSVDFSELNAILRIVALLIVTGFLSGAYPAFYLSAYKPAAILKRKNSTPGRGFSFRSGLIILQFALSIVLIVCTLVVSGQLQEMRNKDLGFDKNNVLYIPIKGNMGKHYETVKTSLLRHPAILSVAAKDCLPTSHVNRTTALRWQGKRPEQDKIAAETTRVDYDYFKTLGLRVIEGRDFSREYSTDATAAFILNEEAVKQMEIQAPVVGKEFALYDQRGTIIGVVKNAYFKSLHDKIEPQVYHVETDWSARSREGVILIKMTGKNTSQVISSIKHIWEQVNPLSPFEYNFLDTAYENLYRAEMQVGDILVYFTILALFVSCLGMFGLASYSAERRTREIGIRKVMGASVPGIVFLLTRDFARWVLLANIIAWPIAFYAMHQWLRNFAYPIAVSPWFFILAGIGALVIALVTVSYQSIRAALSNPVQALKYE